MPLPVIFSAARTPTGRFLGALKTLTAPELGSIAIREAVARAGIDPSSVDECIMGCVVTAGLGQAPARQAALKAGLPDSVGALTINKVCGSGLKAVMLAAQGIATGDASVVVAGGMESMSNTPYALPRVREGLRMGNADILDLMIHDGLWCAFEQCHMGVSGEVVAEKYRVSRDDQDRYAVESHRRAAAATEAGWFRDEMVAVTLPQKKGAPIVVDRDESIRPDTTLEALAKLRPAFKADGSVTAGNAPSVNDGAAALVLTSETRAEELGISPMARIVGQAVSGLPPKYVLMTPVEAVRRLLAKTGWSLSDVDLFELNEAFAAQAVAVIRELGLDPARVNTQDAAALQRSVSAAATALRWRSNGSIGSQRQERAVLLRDPRGRGRASVGQPAASMPPQQSKGSPHGRTKNRGLHTRSGLATDLLPPSQQGRSGAEIGHRLLTDSPKDVG
jgi:acetyl-CoA C-acetyltransferase